MPAIEIDSNERRKVDDLLRFVRNFYGDLAVEGRLVFALEIGRLIKPEIDDLRRRQASTVPNVQPPHTNQI